MLEHVQRSLDALDDVRINLGLRDFLLRQREAELLADRFNDLEMDHALGEHEDHRTLRAGGPRHDRTVHAAAPVAAPATRLVAVGQVDVHVGL